MPEEPLVNGWLPPRAPGADALARPDAAADASGWVAPGASAHPASEQPPEPQPQPRPGAARRDARARPAAPSNPTAIAAIALGASSLLLLVLSLGIAFVLCVGLASAALMLATRSRRAMEAGMPGRIEQARVAVKVAWIALVLSLVAGVVWVVLSSAGFTPQDLQDTLRHELERRRAA